MTHTIGVIRGDGTGPEVVAEGLRVLEAVRDGFEVELVGFDLGAERYLRTAEPLPDEAAALIREAVPENTALAYRSRWRSFEAWCRDAGRVAAVHDQLPAFVIPPDR